MEEYKVPGEIFERAFEKFGEDRQRQKPIEEMAELIQAIVKHNLFPGEFKYRQQVELEIADVLNTIDQIKWDLALSDRDINILRKEAIDRFEAKHL
ncbi:hypothetical protein EHQ53_14170 [Leptospira langatensis]|uniref:Uncharacterized protein n=1 Tax=Leptospira langatensis TaxID=2484983 RepID=A0ABY2MCB8_9LEPT|nr:hypothetical protein [Leptospira langatensis]TGL39664.1 hypothetical protein EHQ53_14170 [Leptospira langatensis]